MKYKHTQRMHNKIAAEEILPFIFSIKKPRNVIDVGCGNGSWLKVVKDFGIEEVLGIDGIKVKEDQLFIDSKEFLKKDLNKPFYLNEKFDLLISLEVAEHLSEDSADDFIESITKHSDLILFSAAIPGQGGQFHYNEQWPNYWNKKFRKFNFEGYDVLRDRFWNNENVFWWYKQNMILYIKKNTLDNCNLQPSDEINSVIHPDLYNKKVTKPKFMSSKKELIKLLKEAIKHILKI